MSCLLNIIEYGGPVLKPSESSVKRRVVELSSDVTKGPSVKGTVQDFTTSVVCGPGETDPWFGFLLTATTNFRHGQINSHQLHI